MKLYIPFMVLAVLSLGSCSTAYRTGQTPDDVYFSPARDKDEYVVIDKEDDRTYRGEEYYEDRYLRNRIRDRYRYSALDDYYNNPYAYNSFGYTYGGYGMGLGLSSIYSPWNSYYTWNNYYNPYYAGYGYGGYGYGGYGGVIIKNPGRFTPPSRAAAFNPRSYGVPASNVRGQSYRPGYNPSNSAGAQQRYNNSNGSRNGSVGNSVRRVFSNNNSSYENGSRSNSNNSTPTRTYNPPSSSGSSSSGSRSSGSSGGGGGSRPIR